MLQFLKFNNDLWIHKVSGFLYEGAFPTEMISIQYCLYPRAKLLWGPKFVQEKKP